MYQRAQFSIQWWARFAGALFLIATLAGVLSGCGDDEEGACADVDCPLGVCQAGQCENASACESDNECLSGYSCTSDGSCEPTTVCQGASDCEAGICSGGVCVNPNSCESNDDCVDRTYCGDDGTCQPDPCNEVECDAGQCLRGTTECVSNDSCTVETEDTDCVDDEQCLDGTCYEEGDYCDALACERGQCSFEERACVNLDDCDGDDANCAEGFFCGDDDQCIEDLCEVNDVECTDGGVCEPSVGECQNPDTCESSADCLTDYLCVSGECLMQEDACEGECPGNQICEYDDEEQTAACAENPNETCTTSLDCTGERQCAGQSCIEPTTCADDQFEPNQDDGESEATDFNVAAPQAALDARICADDTDVYTVDLSQYDLPRPMRGQLQVTANYATRDIGLGELEMRVIGADDVLDETVTSGDMGEDGALEVTAQLNAASAQQYTIEISDAGSVGQPGVNYNLSVNLLQSNTLDACSEMTELTDAQPITADTREAAGYGFGSSCTSPHNDSREQIYFFDIDTTSEVTLNVIPSRSHNDKDFSVSLRESCENIATEVACENTTDQGGELLRTRLVPGRYYAMVETTQEETSGGNYSLTLDTEEVDCAPAQNSCVDADTALVCNENTSGMDTQTCSMGCDPATGSCLRPEADTCEQPKMLADGDIESINWDNFQNDLQVPYGQCLDNNSVPLTSGPEGFYTVRLADGETLTASLSMADGDSGTVYVVKSCQSARSTCAAGAENEGGTDRMVEYINTTGFPETVYVVADTAQGQHSGSAALSISVD